MTTGHAAAAIYVAVMVATAAYLRFDPRNGFEVTTVSGKKLDLLTVLALATGLLWPFYWTYTAALALGGSVARRKLAELAEERMKLLGGGFGWSPPGKGLRIPGLYEDYPRVDVRTVRAGRQTGRWSLLLIEHSDGVWQCVARRDDWPPERLMPTIPMDEAAARRDFDTATGWELEQALAESAAEPPEA